MEDNLLVSIVVPVYKVETYLEECITSILNQTYRNFELILVDDGSPDLCGCICDDFANKDKRIKVIHKENGGLSDARNAGIDIAKGDYITFIDSDDCVNSRYLEVLIKLCNQYRADIVQVGFTSNKTELAYTQQSKLIIKNFSPHDALINMLRMRDVQVIAWAKLYRRHLFENIRYPVGRLNEDNLTTYKLLLSSKQTVVTSSEKLYFYRVNNCGIMNGSFSPKRYEVLSFEKEIRNYMGSQALQFDGDISYAEMRIAFRLYNECINRGASKQFFLQQSSIYHYLCSLDIEKMKIDKKYLFLLFLLKTNRNFYDFFIKKFRA